MTAPPAGGTDRQRASALRNWPQRLLHVAALLAGWAIFFWGWHTVLDRPWENRNLWWLIAGSLVVLPAFTLAWILHNKGIHRRKGARLGVPHVNESYAVDWNGREVRADWVALSRARLVVIDIADERKVYRAAGATALPSQPEPQADNDAADRSADGRPTETADWSAA
ncbi:hypothetical protein [Quisquiliibacterium transsilvanicum]|uniref:Uncharacterized protein n=1 Tax=Quisquiliibacterium transsilvanicum TaxID=1549638 RepID=A0A7W8HF18_9BURK|nr:hypothetical protein [Quisquiliibacterium transsilvanicum]MBB5270693.1 hypothetical protein [Quisquiliibacterium transsilvanicum]